MVGRISRNALRCVVWNFPTTPDETGNMNNSHFWQQLANNNDVAKTVTDKDGNVWNIYRVYRNQPGFVEVHIGKERAERGIKMPTHTYEDWVSGYIRVKV